MIGLSDVCDVRLCWLDVWCKYCNDWSWTGWDDCYQGWTCREHPLFLLYITHSILLRSLSMPEPRDPFLLYSSNSSGLVQAILAHPEHSINHFWPTHFHHHHPSPPNNSSTEKQKQKNKKNHEAKENHHLPATRFELANITVVVF